MQMYSDKNESKFLSEKVQIDLASCAIQATNLSKCYQIYDHPRDRLKQFIMPKLNKITGINTTNYFREFWALKEVSFRVNKGESVGIIGRNGSGKSTLLQIICGTLTPTNGQVTTNGRIAALLELGSGFNPDFTGRENVYLNAMLLGLSHNEINNRFDEIAAFADIGQFIDQPVKTYSSGMYVRLAFSVIAHVDADILVVDEALSVGDAVFNQKCMRFIREFQEHGTLLFVSHDMSSIQNLCQSSIWLSNGEVKLIGDSKEVTKVYLQHTLQEIYGDKIQLESASQEIITNTSEISNMKSDDSTSLAVDYDSKFSFSDNVHHASGWRTGGAEITSLSIEKLDRENDLIFEGGERVKLKILAKANQNLDKPILGFVFRDRLGQDMFGENTLAFTSLSPCPVMQGEQFYGEFIFRLPMLLNGQYVVMASVANGDQYNNIQHHYLHDAFVVNVSSSQIRFGLVGVPFEQVTLKVSNE